MYHRIAVALLVCLNVAPVFAVCDAAKPSDGKASQKHSKTMAAPVSVNFQLGADSGRVSVAFEAPATGVSINVYGVDGLGVSSALQPVSVASFDTCDTADFEVAFVPGEGRSHLVVVVTGNFNGSVRTSTFSHSVGAKSAKQQKPVGSTVIDSDDKRVKLMPAQ
jgi:hypothetical protein